jgi:ribosomal protein L11 methyltransferase
MKWIKVKVVFDQPGNLPADNFYDFGLQGVVVDDPAIEPVEDWAEDAISRAERNAVIAYLPEDSQLEIRCRTLEKKLSYLKERSSLISRVSYKKRDDEDWAHAWKAYFWPRKVGATWW